jgi:hypothetical protein
VYLLRIASHTHLSHVATFSLKFLHFVWHICAAYVNTARRGVGYLIAGIVMLTATGILFFAPWASLNAAAAAVNNGIRHRNYCDDDRHGGAERDDDDDFRFRPCDRHRRHRRENYDDYENEVDDNASLRSPSTIGNHVQNAADGGSLTAGNRSSLVNATRDGFQRLKQQSGPPAKMSARSGTWPTVAVNPSPTEIEMNEAGRHGYYVNGGGVNQPQSPVSTVDKVTDFLRRKCAAVGGGGGGGGGGRSASTVPYWSQHSTVNDGNDVIIGRGDNGRRSCHGERV